MVQSLTSAKSKFLSLAQEYSFLEGLSKFVQSGDSMYFEFRSSDDSETDNDRVSRAADGAIPHLC